VSINSSPYCSVTLVRPTPYGVTHGLTWIAQAKHYKRTQVTTGDVRELVGSKELLVAKASSKVDERYKELRLRMYAPTAVAHISTGIAFDSFLIIARSAARVCFFKVGPSR